MFPEPESEPLNRGGFSSVSVIVCRVMDAVSRSRAGVVDSFLQRRRHDASQVKDARSTALPMA